MPVLTLKLSDDVKLLDATSLAQALTTLSEKVLHKRADVTSVVLQRVAYDAWWIGGARPLQGVRSLIFASHKALTQRLKRQALWSLCMRCSITIKTE